MPVRSTMADLIALVRTMIADPAGANQQFQDIDIQMRLDASRDDIRYESLTIAPSIVNTASTGNQPQTIFADYYSKYGFWEADVTLQAQGPTGAAWVVVSPVTSDLIVGHWQFETDVFNTGTVPGQLPPVFAIGKIYDCNSAAADLLAFWAATLACAYDINVDGQRLNRSQLMQGKLTMAQYYRGLAKPKVAKMNRTDVAAPVGSRRMRLLDADDNVKWGG